MLLQVPVQGFLNSASSTAVEAKESGASWCFEGIWEPPHGRRNSHRATAISKTSTTSITPCNIETTILRNVATTLAHRFRIPTPWVWQ